MSCALTFALLSLFLLTTSRNGPPSKYQSKTISEHKYYKWAQFFLTYYSYVHFTWRNRIGYPAQPGLIRPSVCTYLQIRCSSENGTGPTDLVNYSSKSWIYDVNCESEILRKKYKICERA
jgi:hypothetical protein